MDQDETKRTVEEKILAATLDNAMQDESFYSQFAASDEIETISAEELEQLMQLSLNDIEKLPPAKQGIVWREIAKSITKEDAVKIEASIAALNSAFKKYVTFIDETLPDWWNKALQAFDAFKQMGVLAPYISAEVKEYPDKYPQGGLFTSELIAAAARRARADGKDIPPLQAEEPEQLQFDLPAGAIDGNPSTPAALIDTLKKMPVLLPRAHVMPNNSLINAMQQAGFISGEGFNLEVARERRGQKQLTAYTIIDYEPNEAGVTITDPKMSEYERNVSNAIVSLWVEAEKLGVEPVFTTDTIYRAMPGGGETASPQQRGAITKAIEKYRRTHMTIDATDELRKRKAIDETDTFKLDEYYFQMTRAKRTSKHSGQSVTAYKLTEKPVILKYAEMTRQILSVPAKHLTIRKIDKSGKISTELVTMTADRQSITGYMMRRIAVMKKDKEDARDALKHYERKRKAKPELELPEKTLADFREKSNTILFDTLFSVTNITTDNREQARRYRDFCFDVLEYWKATGFINGYSTQSKGKKITGIIIEI